MIALTSQVPYITLMYTDWTPSIVPNLDLRIKVPVLTLKFSRHRFIGQACILASWGKPAVVQERLLYHNTVSINCSLQTSEWSSEDRPAFESCVSQHSLTATNDIIEPVKGGNMYSGTMATEISVHSHKAPLFLGLRGNRTHCWKEVVQQRHSPHVCRETETERNKASLGHLAPLFSHSIWSLILVDGAISLQVRFPQQLLFCLPTISEKVLSDTHWGVCLQSRSFSSQSSWKSRFIIREYEWKTILM